MPQNGGVRHLATHGWAQEMNKIWIRGYRYAARQSHSKFKVDCQLKKVPQANCSRDFESYGWWVIQEFSKLVEYNNPAAIAPAIGPIQ
jgi:hypothetical protein